MTDSSDVQALPPLTPGARRILDVASELFYERGIHAVGVDTIAEESGVTKRTLYNRFGSKDALILAYLQERDQRWRSMVRKRLDATPPDGIARVLVPFDVLPDWLADSSRGCSFVNAFAELPEEEHPGHQLIVDEKTWLRDLFAEQLTEVGLSEPHDTAVSLTCLHEGAIVCFAIVGEAEAAANVRASAETLVQAALQRDNQRQGKSPDQ